MVLGVLNDYSADQTGKVTYVNSRHEVLAIADNWKALRILDPSLLEMVVESALAITIPDA